MNSDQENAHNEVIAKEIEHNLNALIDAVERSGGEICLTNKHDSSVYVRLHKGATLTYFMGFEGDIHA